MELAPRWLAEYASTIDEETADAYAMYLSNTLVPHFRTLDRITTANADAYVRSRLRHVKATTVRKELSALRRFVAWCVAERYLPSAPEIRGPDKRALGTPAKGKQQHRVDLSPDDVERLLSALPSVTRGKHAARALYTVMWETALRRGTLEALKAPGDYQPGREYLRIRDEADKARFGRDLPLSPRARAALDSACPDDGPIFGPADLRQTLRRAALKAGVDPRVSNHDFRHAALTRWGSTTTDLVGLAYLAGHKHVITTARYVHAHRRAAESVIAASDADSGHSRGHTAEESVSRKHGRDDGGE